MSNEFEWKTEEEAGWEEEIAVPETRPSRYYPWKPIGVFLLIAVLLAGGVRWQINRQVSAVTADVESEVRAAHLFLQRVAGQQDVDLLKSLLSGRDVNWVETQKTLVAEGWFGNPPLMGGTAVPLTASDPLTVTLSPDLFTAEVQSEQSYQLLNPQGMTETVTLRQTAVYRQGEERWLYAPPDDEFWGRMVFHSGEYISVLYPERDEAVVQQLAQDLDELVQAVCRELATRRCLQRALVQVRFSKEPASLLSGVDTGSLLYILSLPTPSLLGLPVDEAGYQALFRVYGAAVATAVITQQVNYQCCSWQLLYQSLLDRQLHQLGLRRWPLNPAVYDQLALQPLAGGVMRLLIDRPSSEALDQMRMYAFVEFLESVAVPDVAVVDMQRSLDPSRSITQWVNEFATTPFGHNSLDQAYSRHIIQQATFSQFPQPSFTPPDTIQMICNVRSFNGRLGLYEYDLHTGDWRELFREETTPYWAFAQSVPSNPVLTFMVEIPSAQGNEINYLLLENGEPLASFTLDDGMDNYYQVNGDPHGRYILLGQWHDGERLAEFRLLDVTACRQGVCQPEQVAGLMVWSPDGRQTLIKLPEDLDQNGLPDSPLVWLGDATGENKKVVGVGERPFWLNNETYGYLQTGEMGWQAWVTAVVGEDTPRPLFSAEDLLATIPQAQRPESLSIITPRVAPDQPGQLYVQADAGSLTYLFSITLNPDQTQAETFTLLHQLPRNSWYDLSPDGRWLSIFEGSRDGFDGVLLTLQNLQTGAPRMMPSLSPSGSILSWSQDGRWYVRVGDGILALGAPDTGYERYIFHDFGNCSQAYWQE
ncbi:MAG: hypothetical protein KJ069_29875 [Anaerolineae bacterium]|nr:hypothetical protein [Anaerolineae bacterium]